MIILFLDGSHSWVVFQEKLYIFKMDLLYWIFDKFNTIEVNVYFHVEYAFQFAW